MRREQKLESARTQLKMQKNRGEEIEDEFFQTLDLRDPDGTSLCPVRRAKFSLPRKRHRLVSIIGNIQIHRAGQHVVNLYCHSIDREEPTEEDLLATFPIEVQQVPPMKQTPHNPEG